VKTLLAALVLFSPAAYGADPFLIFAADASYTDTATLPVLAKYISQPDFLGYRAVSKQPELRGMVPPAHLVQISSSLSDIQEKLQLGCGPNSPHVIFYQWGDPAYTPPAEMADPLGSFARAAAMVHASGCHSFGFLPEGRFFGATHCALNLTVSPYRQVDWSTVDYLDLTGGGLIDDFCSDKTGIADYMKLAQTIVSYVRGKNPKIVIAAHLSFRNTPPATMVQAFQELSGTVDGFLLAYPIYSPQKYANASNLATFLSAVRPVSAH
jgi:hypothetical protein